MDKKQENYTPLLGDISKQFIGEGYEPVPRIVVTAANKLGDTGLMLVGARHWDKVMHAQMDAIGRDKQPPADEIEQGFIDQFGQFLTREEAKHVALMNAQPLIGEDWGKELFSENLH